MDIQLAQFKANLLRLNREELLAIFYMSKRCGARDAAEKPKFSEILIFSRHDFVVKNR